MKLVQKNYKRKFKVNKIEILYVVSLSNTINAFLIPHIKMLVDKGYQVDIACILEQEINPT